MPKFVSWLERAIQEAPQAKASAQQWLASLRKSPIVNQEEVADRGLDRFLTGQEGTIPREQIQGYLATRPMPQAYATSPETPIYGPGGSGGIGDYSTPGTFDYDELVYGNHTWDPRSTSPHFDENMLGEAGWEKASDVPTGYQFHTRGGLTRGNQGRAYMLDELQSDVPRARWPYDPDLPFDPKPKMARFTDSSYNLPGQDSWKWHGMAQSLRGAVTRDADALAWPSGDVHYRRYYPRDPSGLDARVADAEARLDDYRARNSADPEDVTDSDVMDQEMILQDFTEGASKARRDQQMYNNLYDKEMPRHKRWRQLGLEPKLVDFETMPAKMLDKAQPRGKYWVVQLTPEIRKRLRESGIPYYMAGGAAIIGREDEGALD